MAGRSAGSIRLYENDLSVYNLLWRSFSMTKIAQTNVDGINYAMAGASLTGTCSSPASDYMKLVTLTDSDSIEDGVTIACTFAHENSAGTAPSSLTLYSADQIHFYTDAGMTELYTLAPSGCFELTYTGSGNAYSYISYPVVAVGTLSGIVSAPVCDSHGNVTSRRLWKAGDVVFLQYKSRKFFVVNDGSDNSTAGVAFKGTRSAYETAKLIPEGSDGHIPSGALVIITDEGRTYVTNGTGSSQTLELVANATFNGSHAEWNNLTLAQKAMYNIVNFTDDSPSAYKDIYSTNEVKTNKVWIDGKPIYRKVYSITTPDTADTNMSVASIPNNLDMLVYAYFEVNAREIESLSSVYPAPSPKMTGDTNEYLCYWVSFSSSTIRCRVGAQFVSLPLIGIIEYTKTTD
jgi:hypothetical protein